MRWLVRTLITWAVLLPLGYFVGMPYAAGRLQAKTQAETLAQCAQQMQDKGLIGGENALITAEDGDHYCHCLADPLTFTRADLLEMAKQRVLTGKQQPPARLTAQVNAQVEACNGALQQAIIARQPIIIN